MENYSTEVKGAAGTAKIKAEFIAADCIRQLNLDFVTKEDKNKVSQCNDTADGTEEPPKKKLRGQNKKRPRNAKTPKHEKLCFKMNFEGLCPYGNNCSYSHDVDSYLATKPPDLGENCYFFETFGKCPYGFSCRFSTKHIINGKNICNESLWNEMKDRQTPLNVLPRHLQITLRTKNYDFSKSNGILEVVKNGPWKDIFKKDTKFVEKVCSTSDSEKCILSEVSQSDHEIQTTEPKCMPELNSKEMQMSKTTNEKLQGPSSNDDVIKLKPCERKKINFRDKLYLAPLTTVGNLPFRRICKEFGADITCGEMAMATSLLQARLSEWALLKRHHTENVFGVQICGSHPDVMTRCTQMLNEIISVDFIDINMGCPLDFVYKKGSGCGLMSRMKKLEEIVYGMSSVSDIPITLKMRTGVFDSTRLAYNVIQKVSYLKDCISLFTIHGRSREQRYTKSADWNYIKLCSAVSPPVPLFGNGDVLSYEDYNLHKKEANVEGVMIARGALIKPWIFTEIKEQRHWDISSSERFNFIKEYVNYGLEHWGSDSEGVEKTRRFLLEWLSFLYRYIPVGLLEHVPQRINERPPPYFGRNDLETLMASPSCADWIKISEMLLGPVPENFVFLPKHKANAYN